MPLPAPVPEAEALAKLKAIAAQNAVLKSFIGQGYYGTHTPGVILRNILENPAWYTAYTPYQPEISQGRLEALVNFQTMVCDLTGMAIANASMLDEATAAAEAMTLALRVGQEREQALLRRGRRVPADAGRRAHARRAARHRRRRRARPPTRRPAARSPCCCSIRARTATCATTARWPKPCMRTAALVIVAADILALTLLAPPGEWGADAVVGSTQRFGVPMGYGGPHAGYLATRDEFKRSMPGRLVGVTVDAHGNAAYRLALQTREQHIRREKATSNICTAQVLLAVIAEHVRRLSRPGRADDDRAARAPADRDPEGRTRAARLRRAHARVLRHDRGGDGRRDRADPRRRASAHGVNFRRIDDAHARHLARRDDDARGRRAHLATSSRFDDAPFTVADLDAAVTDALPARSSRTSPFLTHPVFHRHRSETEMLRYLRRLADRDLALDRSMIPLGSCTMKLNATSEMIPVTWPEFGALHPFAPAGAGGGLPAG